MLSILGFLPYLLWILFGYSLLLIIVGVVHTRISKNDISPSIRLGAVGLLAYIVFTNIPSLYTN